MRRDWLSQRAAGSRRRAMPPAGLEPATHRLRRPAPPIQLSYRGGRTAVVRALSAAGSQKPGAPDPLSLPRRRSRPRAVTRTLGALEQKSVKVPGMSPVESDEEDLTRKQRREQARAERKAHGGGRGRRRGTAQTPDAARRRWSAVVVVAIVVVLIATSGGSKSGIPKSKNQNDRGRQRSQHRCVDGIPQNGNVLGSPTAPVTLAVLRRPRVPDLPGVHARRAANRSSRSGCARARSRSNTARWRRPRANLKCSRPSRWRRWPPASRKRCGTSSRASTTSREKRTPAT